MSSAGKIVKHLLAKNGPMTTKAFYEFVPTYPEQFISKSHLKRRILDSLEGQGIIFKKANHGATGSKPIWEWKFVNEEHIEKYKDIKL